VNKTAASAAPLAKCILLHASSRCSQLRENRQKLHIAYLTNWNNNIFGYKLRTDYKQLRLKSWKSLKS